MTAKFEMFMNCSKNLIFICKKQTWLPNKEYLRDYRCEGRYVAYNCKIFEAFTLTLHGHYTLVYSFQSYWYKYRKQNMSPKQRIHKCSLMIKYKCDCQMHSTHAYYCWAQSLLAWMVVSLTGTERSLWATQSSILVLSWTLLGTSQRTR